MSSSPVILASIKAAAVTAGDKAILTPDCLAFLAQLHLHFNARRLALVEARQERQRAIDGGAMPTFLAETAHVRAGHWKAAPVPRDILDRRVEITGPPERKMVINALNSGAKVFMADFEDSMSPTWRNALDGQQNMKDALRRTISFTNAKNGKVYKLKEERDLAVLFVRPRGWHLEETHMEVCGEKMSGSLFDFGVYFFHNAAYLLANGGGPYFYLPKMESHLEARLWNDVFKYSQDYCGVPQGSVRATCLIETILAAFEMDEIIYELKEHSAGLNCGRWDYIFSFIKRFGAHKRFSLPDRADVGMTTPFMDNYATLLIQTCHRRGVHAMGGMSASIVSGKNPPAVNEAAIAKVRSDKEREAVKGHDGSWVAGPALIPVAKKAYAHVLGDEKNQIHRVPERHVITAAGLVDIGTKGALTRNGVALNISAGLAYTEAWLAGIGCIAFNGNMEDAATAEISRCQLWQWMKHGASMDDGVVLTPALVKTMLAAEMATVESKMGAAAFNKSKFHLASTLFAQQIFNADVCAEFLTLDAYPHIVNAITTSKL